MSAATNADAAAYVGAVRAELADLEPDVLEELTGGLPADLAELAAESDTPLADRIGAPAAYAAELRAAAGLTAPRSRLGTMRAAPGRIGSQLRAEVEAATSSLEGRRAWAQLRDFLTVLVPAWWVLRAWVAYVLVDRLFTGEPYSAVPARLEGWLVLIALVVLSVQLGREPNRPAWLGRAVLLGNVVALLALPVAASELGDGAYADFAYASEQSIQPGLALDGAPVSNIYAYDADGEPIYGVQLFTADGVPLAIGEHDRWRYDRRGEHPLAPAISADGQQHWNAYPLGIGTRRGAEPALGEAAAPRIPDWAGSLQWFALPGDTDDTVSTPSPAPAPTTEAAPIPTTAPPAVPSLTPPPPP